jgi:nitrogen fixation/metabolism regulation signal transduction histidine kinase
MEAVRLHRPDPDKRSVTRALRLSLVLSVALAAVLLSLLAVASGNNELLQHHYGLLLWLNVGIAIGLAILAIELARRLYIRYRRGLFGTRLMARLAMAFIFMTVVPVLLIYLVAVQFLGRSIESWFDVPMERALDSGLTLGRTTLDSMLVDLNAKARLAASELEATPALQWAEKLQEVRERAGVQEALILTSSGRILQASGSRFSSLVPDMPSAAALRQARVTRSYAAIEPLETAGAAATSPAPTGLKMRSVVALNSPSLGEENRLLQLVHPVPAALSENAEAVQAGFRDYQELSLSRIGLKRIFRVTLTVTVLLTVFSAIAAAFLLAGWMTGPLSMLAAGTRAVAEGDFRPVKDYVGRDELGVLTQSFNAMTRQLEDARAQVERNRVELELANARLASVLSNLTAGVIVLDRDFRVSLANAGAEKILGEPAQRMVGQPFASLPGLAAFQEDISRAFEEAGDTETQSWQRQVAIDAPNSGDTEQRGTGKTLLLRGALLPEAHGDHLLVIDDITDVVSAQRAIAWSEVARRLAHEIKNPLTPIQLAAERMEFKLGSKLAGTDRDLLARNTRTIVNQVGALKLMVDEFRDYARLPTARLAPLSLNDLVTEILSLYADTDPNRTVRVHLTPGLPRILGDAGQLRQVIHNLFKNAIEATEKQPVRILEVFTDAAHNTAGQINGVRLVVRDNGPGFEPAMMARVFEPYVSSKAKGTGLGLVIVRKIVQDHGGRVEVGNRPEPFPLPAMPGSEEGGALATHVPGAYVNVLFAKLEKSDDNFSVAATEKENRLDNAPTPRRVGT